MELLYLHKSYIKIVTFENKRFHLHIKVLQQIFRNLFNNRHILIFNPRKIIHITEKLQLFQKPTH